MIALTCSDAEDIRRLAPMPVVIDALRRASPQAPSVSRDDPRSLGSSGARWLVCARSEMQFRDPRTDHRVFEVQRTTGSVARTTEAKVERLDGGGEVALELTVHDRSDGLGPDALDHGFASRRIGRPAKEKYAMAAGSLALLAKLRQRDP